MLKKKIYVYIMLYEKIKICDRSVWRETVDYKDAEMKLKQGKKCLQMWSAWRRWLDIDSSDILAMWAGKDDLRFSHDSLQRTFE